ncbi:hypothetical protein Btru_025677 [Bulinus truncatus]|nr:hypothetical protein Btru_025677 [Bulinus truncatus]
MSTFAFDENVERELKFLMGWRKGISFIPGTPELQLLKSCSTMLHIASDSVLKDPDVDVGNLFKYGEGQGDKHFREQLASFLSDEYSDNVKSSNLMVTAGATQGLHAILSLLCEKDSPVFLEDPTYFLASRMIKEDLKLSTVPGVYTHLILEIKPVVALCFHVPMANVKFMTTELFRDPFNSMALP